VIDSKTCGQSPRVHNRRLLQQNLPKADIGTFTAAPQTQQSRWPDE